MIRAKANAAALRRVKDATVRSENAPRVYVVGNRPPRLAGAPAGHAWCQLTASVGPATGTWPDLSATGLTAQTLYQWTAGAFAAIPGTFTVNNWRNVTWATGKTTLVVPNADGTWDIVDQDC